MKEKEEITPAQKKQILFKALKAHSLQTVCIYAFVYLFYSFIIFKITNPFRVIINIPTYDQEARGLGLFMYILYNTMSICINYSFCEEKLYPKIKK